MKCVGLVSLLSVVINVTHCSSKFTITPASSVIATGEEAVFRCQARSSRYYDWIANGSYLGQNPPLGITPGTERDQEGALVHTLTILGQAEFNQTQVKCEVIFWNGSTATSPPATLTITDPENLTVARGETVRLECFMPNAIVSWKINDTILNGQNYNGLQFEPETEPYLNGSELHTLTFTTSMEYNDLTISCMINGRNILINKVKLVVQDVLGKVVDIVRNPTGNIISWTPPVTKNLSNAEPDIVYCMSIYNTTCGRDEEQVMNICDIYENTYNDSDGILIPTDTYDIAIKAQNNVKGASHSEVENKKEVFIFWNSVPTVSVSIADDDSMTIEIFINGITEGDVDPKHYSLLLDPLAEEQGNVSADLIPLTKTTLNDSFVAFKGRTLLKKGLWNATIVVSGCYQSKLSSHFEMSVPDHEVTSPQPDLSDPAGPVPTTLIVIVCIFFGIIIITAISIFICFLIRYMYKQRTKQVTKESDTQNNSLLVALDRSFSSPEGYGAKYCHHNNYVADNQSGLNLTPHTLTPHLVAGSGYNSKPILKQPSETREPASASNSDPSETKELSTGTEKKSKELSHSHSEGSTVPSRRNQGPLIQLFRCGDQENNTDSYHNQRSLRSVGTNVHTEQHELVEKTSDPQQANEDLGHASDEVNVQKNTSAKSLDTGPYGAQQ